MPRVLVVDDDADIRRLVEFRLCKNGHKVLSAASGEEALAIVAERGAPDVAVLDVAMPGMSGLELAPALRAQTGVQDLPVIFLSARVQGEDIEAGRALGASYLTKPFVATALLSFIDKALATEAAETEHGW